MHIKKILLLLSLFISFNYKYNSFYLNNYLLKIPKFNLNITFDKNSTLDNNIELYSEKRPFIIMGHSGSGSLALFNDIEYLNNNDEIILYHKNVIYYYKVVRKNIFIKGSILSINDNKNYLYLITCDKKDLTKQLIITAKNTKIIKN